MAHDPPLSPSVVELDGPFEHRFLHTRGLRLHAAVAGDPADPLILLVHDSFGGWFDFADVIAPLAHRGYHVAALDLRGYGMSDKPPVQAGSWGWLLAGDLAGAISALGHDKAIVVGADTGGTLGWILATTHPEQVSTLVSISAAHPVDLRRAVAARPWDFTWILGWGLGSRIPPRVLRGARSNVDKAHQHYLQANTTVDFHRSPRFEPVLSMRQTASRIGSTLPAALHTTRLQLGILPPKQMFTPVQADTLLLHPNQGIWTRLSARAEDRVTGRFAHITVPGTKNMPHIEAPAQFVRVVDGYLQD